MSNQSIGSEIGKIWFMDYTQKPPTSSRRTWAAAWVEMKSESGKLWVLLASSEYNLAFGERRALRALWQPRGGAVDTRGFIDSSILTGPSRDFSLLKRESYRFYGRD